MSSNQFHFITNWQIQGTVEEVSAVLGDAADLVRWWPAVYLDVQEIEPGQEDGVGQVISLFTKGWLPYTLRWQLRVTENRHPYGLSLAAMGDFVGRGIWTFTPDGPNVAIRYNWKIEAQKPLLRRLSFLLKPIFAANHYWAMDQGEKSLKLELARRRATSPAERAAVPPPPGPTFKWLIKNGKA